MNATPRTPAPPSRLWRWAIILTAVIASAAAFGYVGGWLAPQRLTAQRIVDQFQATGGVHPGFRRNHAKGTCVSGYFDSNGSAEAYSMAEVFTKSRTPVVGRFAIPGPNPYAPDSSVPIRSMALRFRQPDGEQWRTGMNSMPVFPVATPQAFYAQMLATAADPATGKPDPQKVAAFFAAHPETAAFRTWAKTTSPPASYTLLTYYSLNAFYLVDAQGRRQAVRWRMVPEAGDTDGDPHRAGDHDYLEADLKARIARGPLRWHLLLTLANPGDPTDDATKTWPSDRRTIDAGTLVLEATQPQTSGECRDINYDPTVLPHGIAISDDPLLPARSAVYAASYLRRTSEEAHLPGTADSGRPTHSQEQRP